MALGSSSTVLLKQQVIGHHVRQLRRRAGLSSRALGGRTNFSASFISQLENGLVSPSIGSMQKIAAALGVTLGEFFTAAGQGATGTIGKHPYGHDTAEDYAFVLKGPVTLTLGPDRHVLRTGDAVCFLPGELRLWENPGRIAARLLFVSVRS